MPSRMVYRAIWVPCALTIMGLTAVFARQPYAIPIPGPFTSFTTSDKLIALQHPDNWKPRQTSAHSNLTRVKFTPSRTLYFSVSADLQGSLMADMARSSSTQSASITDMANALPSAAGSETRQEAKQKSPLEKLHEMQSAELQKNEVEYAKFEDGKTTPTQISGMEALVTEFGFQQASVLGSHAMTGLRATVLTNERRVEIICYGPKEGEKVFKPVFEKMIESIKLGQGGQ